MAWKAAGAVACGWLLAAVTAGCADTKPQSDASGLGDVGSTDIVDADGDGFSNDEDCNDADAAINPGALELCDGVDNNCSGAIDEGVTDTFYADVDGDGYGTAADAVEACEVPAGFVPGDSDCDDTNPDVHPMAEETCNGLDDDCNGTVDDGVLGIWYADVDGDGYGDPDTEVEGCAPSDTYVSGAGDCDDGEASVNPDAVEVCNEVDDDCDDAVDEGVTTAYFADADGDGYGRLDSTTEACDVPAGYAEEGGDCDDGAELVNPGMDEICNEVDDNCDGVVDEDSAVDARTWYADADTDGFGDAGSTTQACAAPSGFVADATDCDDSAVTTNPAAAEYCDGHDDDCDGDIDEDDAVDAPTWYRDSDGDTFGDASVDTQACSVPAGYVVLSTDCDDTDADVSPGATEVCNGVDDDCDALIDDNDSTVSGTSTFYTDADSDGYGDASSTQAACVAPAGTVADATDCDDGNRDVSPAGTEVCNGIDDDCDGDVDDDDSSVTSVYTWYLDFDGDTYGSDAFTAEACVAPSGYVELDTDCDDTEFDINPAAAEVCNSIDDDCDGDVDDDDSSVSGGSTWYLDDDGDGYGIGGTTVEACTEPGGYADNDTDCDDGEASVYPSAPEVCDGLDNDCDTDVDEGVLGSASDCAAESCWEILDAGASLGDRSYYLDPDGTGASLWECDMTTDGGGWTLVADWNRVDDGDNKADFNSEFTVLFNNMSTFSNGSNHLFWQDDTGSGSANADALSVEKAITVDNGGEVLYTVEYDGVSMEQSGSWLWVEDAGTQHTLECWEDITTTAYSSTELAQRPSARCSNATSPRDFSWSGTVQDDLGGSLDKVRFASLHYDSCCDYSYLYMFEFWVR